MGGVLSGLGLEPGVGGFYGFLRFPRRSPDPRVRVPRVLAEHRDPWDGSRVGPVSVCWYALWRVCSIGGKIWFMRAQNFMDARLLRRRCGRHGRFARLCGSHGRPVDVLAALGRRRGHLHHHFLLSWLADSPRRPRATRRSRRGSTTAAHEGPLLIFGSSSRSRVSIARASRQLPRLFQICASRREASF